MPLDSLVWLEVADQPFVYEDATPEERLVELARLLEHEEEWRGWLLEWDYATELLTKPACGSTIFTLRKMLYPNECGTSGCALGLAVMKWPAFCHPFDDFASAAMQAFGFSDQQVDRLFYGEAFGHNYAKVTPGMVALEIRKLLRRRHAQKRRVVPAAA
jgi:hypothetical protein